MILQADGTFFSSNPLSHLMGRAGSIAYNNGHSSLSFISLVISLSTWLIAEVTGVRFMQPRLAVSFVLLL
jgi:hypothetical protein